MDILTLIILLGFGLIVGSFLNVVILRFDTGFSISKGRSQCFSCAKALRWYELVPLCSFLIQRGRCRGCSTRISWQYPLVEVLGALAFVLGFFLTQQGESTLFTFLAFILTTFILCLYIVIAVYDMRHKIIPDIFSYSAAIAGVLIIGISYMAYGVISYDHIFAGIGMAFFFFFFWFISRGTWMGLGDAKLALSMGFVLGVSKGVVALLLSFWIGALVSIGIMILGYVGLLGAKHKLGFKSEIPFGPYLIIGFLIALIWNIDIPTLFSLLAV